MSVARQQVDGVLDAIGLRCGMAIEDSIEWVVGAFFATVAPGVRFRDTLCPKQADWVLLEPPAAV